MLFHTIPFSYSTLLDSKKIHFLCCSRTKIREKTYNSFVVVFESSVKIICFESFITFFLPVDPCVFGVDNFLVCGVAFIFVFFSGVLSGEGGSWSFMARLFGLIGSEEWVHEAIT